MLSFRGYQLLPYGVLVQHRSGISGCTMDYLVHGYLIWTPDVHVEIFCSVDRRLQSLLLLLILSDGYRP